MLPPAAGPAGFIRVGPPAGPVGAGHLVRRGEEGPGGLVVQKYGGSSVSSRSGADQAGCRAHRRNPAVWGTRCRRGIGHGDTTDDSCWPCQTVSPLPSGPSSTCCSPPVSGSRWSCGRLDIDARLRGAASPARRRRDHRRSHGRPAHHRHTHGRPNRAEVARSPSWRFKGFSQSTKGHPTLAGAGSGHHAVALGAAAARTSRDLHRRGRSTRRPGNGSPGTPGLRPDHDTGMLRDGGLRREGAELRLRGVRPAVRHPGASPLVVHPTDCKWSSDRRRNARGTAIINGVRTTAASAKVTVVRRAGQAG